MSAYGVPHIWRPAMRRIATLEVGRDLPVGCLDIDFRGLPTDYTDLLVAGQLRMDTANASAHEIRMQCSGDQGANYGHVGRYYTAGLTDGYLVTGVSHGQTSNHIGYGALSSITAGFGNAFELHLPNYSQRDYFKTWWSRGSYVATTAATDTMRMDFGGAWLSLLAIARLRFFSGNAATGFADGSVISIYGTV